MAENTGTSGVQGSLSLLELLQVLQGCQSFSFPLAFLPLFVLHSSLLLFLLVISFPRSLALSLSLPLFPSLRLVNMRASIHAHHVHHAMGSVAHQSCIEIWAHQGPWAHR